MKNVYLIILLNILSSCLISQSKQELFSIWKNIKLEDTARAESFYQLIKKYYLNSDSDSAFLLSEELSKFSKKKNLPLYQSRAWRLFGYVLTDKGDSSAVDSLYKAVDLAKTNNFKDELLRAYQSLGYYYVQENKDSLALGVYLESLKYGGEKSSLALANLGRTYDVLGNFDRATFYYFKALKLDEENRDTVGLIHSYWAIASVYSNNQEKRKSITYNTKALLLANEINYLQVIPSLESMIGMDYLSLEVYDTAYKYIFRANISVADNRDVPTIILRKASYYIVTKKYAASLPYLDSAINVCLTQNSLMNLGIAYQKKGYVLFNLREFDKAEMYYLKSKKIYADLYWNEGMINLYKDLSEVYEKQNKPQKSLEMFKMYHHLNDSLSAEDKRLAIVKKDFAHQQEKSALEIANLELENEKKETQIKAYIYSSLGGCVILVLLFVLGYFTYKRKKEKEENEFLKLEQKLLRTQMNPHFIFNSLSAIQNFLYSNKTEETALYLGKFAKLMRNILESSREDKITLEKEIEIITHFMELHKLRLKDKLNYSIEIDENIDETEIEIPPMLLQPFIENAVQHGVEANENGGNINIVISEENEVLKISVKDDGEGITQKYKVITGQHKSYAIDITKERLANINKKSKSPILFNITNLAELSPNLKGTKVSFSIPQQ